MDVQKVKFCLGRTVRFENRTYVFTGCIMRQGVNGFYYQAELKDTKAQSSLVIADLAAVEEEVLLYA